MTDFSLSLRRDTRASAAALWRCLTEPELLRQWFAPKPVEVKHVELDPRPGGAFRVVMLVPEIGEMDGGYGCVLLAEPEARLVWTSALGPEFVPNAPPAEGQFAFTADIRLTPIEGGCTYHATAHHATAEARDAHAAMGFEEGWGTAADQLAELAATL